MRTTAAHRFSGREKCFGCDKRKKERDFTGKFHLAVADSCCHSLITSFLFFSFPSFGPTPISIRAGKRVHKFSLEFRRPKERFEIVQWEAADLMQIECLAISMDSTGIHLRRTAILNHPWDACEASAALKLWTDSWLESWNERTVVALMLALDNCPRLRRLKAA